MFESKRIKKLREHLIKTIPKSPNTRETKEELEQQGLSTILIHYLNWASRFVSERKRKVHIRPAVTSDNRWKKVRDGVNSLLNKVRAGESLTPYLSLVPRTKGYVLSESEAGKKKDRWDDKDFLLNVMGYHHFHLGLTMKNDNHIERTDEVLFARVTRGEFTAIALFDHDVFESPENAITAERERLWKIFDKETKPSTGSGVRFSCNPITTSGHPLHIINLAQNFNWNISERDPQLDNYEYLKTFYNRHGLDVPKRNKLEWYINCTDLCLIDKVNKRYFTLCEGLN